MTKKLNASRTGLIRGGDGAIVGVIEVLMESDRNTIVSRLNLFEDLLRAIQTLRHGPPSGISKEDIENTLKAALECS